MGPILQRLKLRLPKLEPPLTHSAVRAPSARLVACGWMATLGAWESDGNGGANEKIICRVSIFGICVEMIEVISGDTR